MHSDMLGTQVINVTRGYYWKVAVRHYWYPTSTSAAMSSTLVWAPAMITNFVPQDVFAASLYQSTSGNYCFAQ